MDRKRETNPYILGPLSYSNFLFTLMVTEHKFVCPTHSEAKQTKMSEFGTEKGLLQGHARRTGGLCPPKFQTPQRFSAKHF